MFPRFQTDVQLEVFKLTYCESDNHRFCQRYKHASAGDMPSADLLPNGQRLVAKAS